VQPVAGIVLEVLRVQESRSRVIKPEPHLAGVRGAHCLGARRQR
jgi:hypothetical protein